MLTLNRLSLWTLLITLTLASVTAKSYSQRLSLGIGVSTLSHEDIFPDSRFSLDHTLAIPNYWAQVRVNISKIYINGTIQFDKRTVKEYSLLTPTDSILSHWRQARNTAMLGVGYYWMQLPFIKVYSDINLGYQMVLDYDKVINKSYTQHDIAYHITFVGFRLGGKLALITELGYGRKGIFSVGISYKG